MATVGSKLAKLLGQAQYTQPTCSECPSIKSYQAWDAQFNLEQAKIPMVSFSIPNNPDNFNLVPLPRTAPLCTWDKDKYRKEQKEKECAMRATIDTTTDSSLDYINNRLSSILWDKSSDIEKKFEPVKPKNAKQAKEWLKEGNYRIEIPDYYNEDTSSAYVAVEYLAWGKTGPDLKAKAAADESLYKEFQAAKDTVAILSNEQARLKALKDFEAYSVN